MSRRDQATTKAAEREARSGAGPVPENYDLGPNPGATARFGLFGEVLATGLLITLVALPVVTLPIALAAGIRQLRRFVAAEDSRAALFWGDVRAGILPSLVVGVPATLVAAVLAVDVLVARTGALPGSWIVGVVGWAGLLALTTAVLVTAGAWAPSMRWIDAVRAVPGLVRADTVGAVYLAATAVFVGVVTWALVPLFIPGIGCAALAVVGVPARRRP